MDLYTHGRELGVPSAGEGALVRDPTRTNNKYEASLKISSAKSTGSMRFTGYQRMNAETLQREVSVWGEVKFTVKTKFSPIAFDPPPETWMTIFLEHEHFLPLLTGYPTVISAWNLGSAVIYFHESKRSKKHIDWKAVTETYARKHHGNAPHSAQTFVECAHSMQAEDSATMSIMASKLGGVFLQVSDTIQRLS